MWWCWVRHDQQSSLLLAWPLPQLSLTIGRFGSDYYLWLTELMAFWFHWRMYLVWFPTELYCYCSIMGHFSLVWQYCCSMINLILLMFLSRKQIHLFCLIHLFYKCSSWHPRYWILVPYSISQTMLGLIAVYHEKP